MERKLVWMLVTVALTAGGCEVEEGLTVDDDDRYVAACTTMNHCLCHASNWTEWSSCIMERDPESTAPVAAFDLDFCGGLHCFDECQISENDCAQCVEERCSGAWDACRGDGWEEYEESYDGYNHWCYSIRLCNGDCPEGDIACSEECYIDSTPKARRHYYEMFARSAVDCAEPCFASDADAEGCEACMKSNFQDDLPECFEEYFGSSGGNPSGVYSECAGIEDSLMLCLCSSSDPSLCYGL